MTIGVAPRSDAIEKYARLVVARMMMANWWKRRVPRGRYVVLVSTWSHQGGGRELTVKSKKTVTNSPRVIKENAAQSQSEP